MKSIYDERMKMVDVIHHDFRLIPVINRFGIQFGFGNKTVAEVCEDYSVNTNFFLEIISSYSDMDYFPTQALLVYPIEILLDYLKKTHKFYIEEKVPEIRSYIQEMISGISKNNYSNVQLISDFFDEYTKELKIHLDNEEQKVFPYIRILERIQENKEISETDKKFILNYSINLYEKNHNSLEVKLSDLKNLLIKYLHPESCQAICRKILIELYRLESDIENHTLIEEKVLIPKVKELEKRVLTEIK